MNVTPEDVKRKLVCELAEKLGWQLSWRGGYGAPLSVTMTRASSLPNTEEMISFDNWDDVREWLEKKQVGGRKYDAGKLRMDLIPGEAIEQLAAVLSYGAEKYDEDNWKRHDVEQGRKRHWAALMRHAVAYQKGEPTDPDSGLSHLAHLVANAAFVIWAENQKKALPLAWRDGRLAVPGAKRVDGAAPTARPDAGAGPAASTITDAARRLRADLSSMS